MISFEYQNIDMSCRSPDSARQLNSRTVCGVVSQAVALIWLAVWFVGAGCTRSQQISPKITKAANMEVSDFIC